MSSLKTTSMEEAFRKAYGNAENKGQYSFATETDTEAVNRIKDLNGRRARTPDESRELVELLYNQFGKDTPEFADVRNDIASPIYSTRSDENISHIVNSLISRNNVLRVIIHSP
ncbi:MAG: hypothetical protein UH854_02275 [Clostridia bacterium]|nr:hypothetical protein [Clostridia bacterium]